MTIIIIDDNTTELLKNEAILRKLSCIKEEDTVYTYTSGEFFLNDFASWDKTEIDVAVIDYNLGSSQANGYEVITQMQSAGYFGMAILLTGDDSEQMRHLMKLTAGLTYAYKDNDSMLKICELITKARHNE